MQRKLIGILYEDMNGSQRILEIEDEILKREVEKYLQNNLSGFKESMDLAPSICKCCGKSL